MLYRTSAGSPWQVGVPKVSCQTRTQGSHGNFHRNSPGNSNMGMLMGIPVEIPAGIPMGIPTRIPMGITTGTLVYGVSKQAFSCISDMFLQIFLCKTPCRASWGSCPMGTPWVIDHTHFPYHTPWNAHGPPLECPWELGIPSRFGTNRVFPNRVFPSWAS